MAMRFWRVRSWKWSSSSRGAYCRWKLQRSLVHAVCFGERAAWCVEPEIVGNGMGVSLASILVMVFCACCHCVKLK